MADPTPAGLPAAVAIPTTVAPTLDTKVKFDGKEVDLGSLENMKAMAQKGMLMERTKRQLDDYKKSIDDERARMAPQLKTMEELFRFKSFNPKGYDVMNRIFKGDLDPDKVLSIEHGNGDAGQTSPAQATPVLQELEDMRSKLANLEKVLDATRGAVYQRTLDERIEAAIEGHSELRSPKARELAKAQIAAAVSTGSIDPEAAATMVASDFKAFMDEKVQAERDRLAKLQGIGAVPPTLGHPAFPLPQIEFKKGMKPKEQLDLLKSGFRETMAKMARGATSGPGPS